MTEPLGVAPPSPDHPYHDVFLRLRRAEHLMEQLKTEANSYLASSPAKFGQSRDEGTGMLVLTLIEIESPPLTCRFLTSEIFHHFRSILDNMAFVIGTLDPGPTFDPERVSWPIPKSLGILNDPNNKLLSMFSARDQALFRELQSAQDGRRSFRLLHRVNNSDKHRSPLKIIAVPMQFSVGGFSMINADGEEKGKTTFAPGPWEIGSVVARTELVSLHLSGNVEIVIDENPIDGTTTLNVAMVAIWNFVNSLLVALVERHRNPDVKLVLLTKKVPI